MKSITLFPQKDYDKLYFFLKDEGLSESLISVLRKDSEAMTVNEISANMRTPLKSGDEVSLTFRDTLATQVEFNDLPLDILFENEDLLVVNKPAGIPTIPSRSHYSLNLAGAVCKYMKAQNSNFVFRALGRLDKETSGIVIIAKNQWAAGMTTFKKTYLALCHGEFEEKEFSICGDILTESVNGINSQKRIVADGGKSATTFVKVIKSKKRCSLLEIKLKEGRTHQIRVHLSNAGHPLVGDKLYGAQDDAPRAMLHAYKTEITLPTKELLYIEAPIPEDFKGF